MADILFTVPGEPVPYLRMTQGQVKLMRIADCNISAKGMKVKERLRKYFTWKDWVYACSAKYPIEREPKTKVYMNVFCYFRNRTHGDPENIRKGIQDAIYKQDRYVAGAVDFLYDEKNPRCEIQIIQGGG